LVLHQGHELLRILPAANDVGAPNDHDRDVERVGPRWTEQLGSCLGGRVRIGRVEGVVLAELSEFGSWAKYLVCRHAHNLADRPLPCPLEQVERAHYVVLQVFGRGDYRAVNVACGSQVNDNVNVTNRAVDVSVDGAGEVVADELDASDGVDAAKVACTVEAVEHDYLVALGDEVFDIVVADEAAAAGNEVSHAPPPR